MKRNDLSQKAIGALETLRKWNDEENNIGPPAGETDLAQELFEYGLIERVMRPVVNQRGAQAIVGHKISEKGRKLLDGEEV